MRNENCDRKSKCDDYKHNHCDGCGGNKSKGDLISLSRRVLKNLISDKSIPIKFEEEIRGEWRYSSGVLLSDIYKIIDTAPTVEPRIEYGTDGQPYRFFMSGGQVVPDTLQGWRYEERPQGKCKDCDKCEDKAKSYSMGFQDGYWLGGFQLTELRRWLTSQGYSEGTVNDKINEFTGFVEKIRGEE